MTAQIKKMDATGKSNTMLISKLKKKLGSFYHSITIRPSRISMKFFMVIFFDDIDFRGFF